MKFKLDENLPELVRQVLVDLEYDVHTVSEEGLSRANDVSVLAACRAEDRVLITLDLDFSDGVRVPPIRPTSNAVVN